MENLMRIGFVSYHCCIRVIKEYLALATSGQCQIHSTRLLHPNMSPEHILPITNHGFYIDKTSFMMLMQDIDLDLFHCHNEPDWFPSLIREVRPDAKIVYDIHDSHYMRWGETTMQEKESIEAADAFIFPSQTYLDEMTKFFGLQHKPKIVVHSMCTESMIVEPRPNEIIPRETGIVHEGGAVANPDKWNTNVMPYPVYRDQTGVARALSKQGIPFYLFGVNEKYVPAYAEAGAKVFPSLSYGELLRTLATFDWGYVGSAVDSPQCQSAMANKMFEYIAAGIPVIVLNSREMGKFVEDNGVGVHIEHVDEISEIYHLHKQLRPVVQKKRFELCMETQVDKMLEFYRLVLGLPLEEN